MVNFIDIENDPNVPYNGPERRQNSNSAAQTQAEVSALNFLIISIVIFAVGIAIGYAVAVRG